MPQHSGSQSAQLESLGSLFWFMSKAVVCLIVIIVSVVAVLPGTAQGAVASGPKKITNSLGNAEKRAVKAYLKGETIKAEKWCTVIDSLDIQNSTAFLIRIMLLEDLGGREQARELYEELLENDPTNRWAMARLGRIYAEDGKLQEAYTLIDNSLRGQKKYSDSYVAQACYYGATNDYRKAVSSLEKASASGASPLLCEIRKFNYLLYLEDFDSALSSIKTMRTIAPFLLVTGFLQGRLFFLRGNPEKAKAFLNGYLSSAQAHASLKVDALEILATIDEREDDFSSAGTMIDRAIEISTEALPQRVAGLSARRSIVSSRKQLLESGVVTEYEAFSILHSKSLASSALSLMKESLSAASGKLARCYPEVPAAINVVVIDTLSLDIPAHFDVFRGEIVLSAPAFEETGYREHTLHMVTHEMSHNYLWSICGHKAFRKINLWAIEGLAELHSLGPVSTLSDRSVIDSTQYSFEQLGNLLSADSEHTAFERKEAYLAARLMVQAGSDGLPTASISRFLRFIERISANASVDDAFVSSFGINSVKYRRMSKSFVVKVLNQNKRAAIMLQ